MRRGIAFLLLAIFAHPAPASAADLRLGLAVEPDSIDPHYHNFGGNKSLMPNLFDSLTSTDAQDHLTPDLAVSWRLIDDTTWEFKLRPDVIFSDGAPLTADDVAFTIERVPNVPTTVTDMSEYVKPIARVEVLDPHTVRFHTKGPFPLAPEYLSAIGILSRRHGEGAGTSVYNTGKAAIGTGPYRFVSWARGDKIILARNETWWGGHPAWDNVTIRYIKNPASRLAALLAGDVDLIDQVSVQDFSRVKNDARFTVASGLSDDLVGFVFDVQDHSSPTITDNDDKPLTANPFRDRRVREAVSLAIDRAAIRDRIMNGQSDPDDQYMKPGQHATTTPRCRPYNPIHGRPGKLLAAAGLSQRVQTRRRLPERPLRQRRDDLPDSGADADPRLRHRLHAGGDAARRLECPTRTGTSSACSPISGPSIRPSHRSCADQASLETPDTVRGRGAFNRGVYSNPQFDAVLDQALVTLDSATRARRC